MDLHVTETGEGPPLALLHGLFGAGGNFGALARRLGATRRVLSPDLRNHGASPHAPGMAYPDLARDVATALAARGARPAAVVGHSMGGKVAMALALAEPAAVSRLVVADIAPVRYPPAFRAFAAALRALDLRPGLTRREADAALAPAVPEPGVRAFLLQNLAFPPGGAPAWRIGLDAIADALPQVEDFPDLPGRYPGPVLVLSGGRSDYVRPEHHEAVLARFPAARFAVLPGAGHWLHADDPEGFLAALSAFLAEGP